ncbi:nucleotidyltransferase domain-containing protein [Photobacterium salinisoli]|uniref:nucleotidyltransferase domain-containing protein n=1 Tax=Photobacterium salinisoli TaxID=1616783 RepID=UPI000EA370AC|nr:nucleotidyltransferase domain-containing protein [Photobacterium salinisoli]
MSTDELNIEHLPLQNELVKSVLTAFSSEENVVAAVLLGSLAAGKGDRISDADILIFTQNGFHKTAGSCFSTFESGKEIFYFLEDFHNENAFFKKYIFNDFTSAEIHCLDVNEPFNISKPFKVLFDKADIVEPRLTDEPAPKHENFPAYTNGDKGLIWELFDCIKWLSRDNHELAKSYLKKLSDRL